MTGGARASLIQIGNLVDLTADEVDQWLVEKATSLSTRTVADLKSILRRAITRAQTRIRE